MTIRKIIRAIVLSGIIITGMPAVFAQTNTTENQGTKKKWQDFHYTFKKDSLSPPVTLAYGKKGWEFEYDNHFLMQVEWRFQFRAQFNSEDTFFFVDEEDDKNGSFNLQRARLKVGGYAYKPFIKYYLEYDFPSNSLLNWEFTIAKFKALQLKVGQWKIKYNTERYISSGKQQFVDRSIANRYFTLDRQIGIAVIGDLFEGKVGSSSYNIGIFNGNGRMAQNDDGRFLFFARYQWNFSRHPMKMYFCDLKRVSKPQGFIALAYAYNQSAFTRFSTSGGGELPGYPAGKPEQYLIIQYNLEIMFKYQGFSLASENHIKNIDDKVLKQQSQLYGGYVMAGYFFNEIIDFIPKQLEFITRFSMISNDTFYDKNINEYSIGFNWFFNGHRNKLTTDLAYIDNQDFDRDEDNFRFRIQWDISF